MTGQAAALAAELAIAAHARDLAEQRTLTQMLGLDVPWQPDPPRHVARINPAGLSPMARKPGGRHG